MALFFSIQAGSAAKTVIGAALVGAGLTVSGQVADDYALRERAYALADTGQCSAAVSAFTQLGRNGGDARDWLAAATCAIEAGDHARAVEALQQVLPQRHTLTIDEQLFALRSYGYQAEAYGDWQGVHASWSDAAQLSGETRDRLMAARGARLAGFGSEARRGLDGVEPRALAPRYAAIYHDERAHHAASSGRYREALAQIDQAVTAEDVPFRRYQQGLYMVRLGMNRSATHAFELALASDPDNANILMSLAYAYRAAGNLSAARDIYARAARLEPSMSRVAADFS
ncbi:MAG: tetratricopeptide repeat protein [Oceanicaulis sp.]|uniref:tetratricopeptide repeat protein n=1 Tax=Glycocaulis sp. TaxID=1969725 RepID=UPI0025C02434|nr:tetratricopeptide repeat protein [Glycocaulis sp.]MCC5980407.1 tetratricopeptide repeat protein [Oceanicaulis sp.]MCH8520926.1 tetratricopeptide repeat protein [Glycocaulis sp.]